MRYPHGIPLNSKPKQRKKIILVCFLVFIAVLFSSLLSDLDTKHHEVFGLENNAYAKTNTTSIESYFIGNHNLYNLQLREEYKDPKKIKKVEKMASWIYKKTSKVPNRLASEYAEFIVDNIDPNLQLLVCAHLVVESNGDMFAKSKRGDLGILQIFPKSWQNELISAGIIREARDLYDYRNSVISYQYIMKQLLSENKGNLENALTDYFGGRRSVKKTLGLLVDIRNFVIK